MKKCPFCAEEIQDAAIKCKHCGQKISGGGGALKLTLGIIGGLFLLFTIILIFVSPLFGIASFILWILFWIISRNIVK